MNIKRLVKLVKQGPKNCENLDSFRNWLLDAMNKIMINLPGWGNPFLSSSLLSKSSSSFLISTPGKNRNRWISAFDKRGNQCLNTFNVTHLGLAYGVILFTGMCSCHMQG